MSAAPKKFEKPSNNSIWGLLLAFLINNSAEVQSDILKARGDTIADTHIASVDTAKEMREIARKAFGTEN